MPTIEAAFAVVVAAYRTLLAVAMGDLAFVVSKRQDPEIASPSSGPSDPLDSETGT